MRFPRLPSGFFNRENIRTWASTFELWFTKATRIAVVMVRGAYWLGERKKLQTLLGAQTYEQIRNGKADPAAQQELAKQLDRMNEKLQSEEDQLQWIRVGNKETPS